MIPDKPITLAMRAPENSGNATIAIFADGGWQDLHAEPSGLPDIWVTTTLPSFGTFAVIIPGAAGPCRSSPRLRPRQSPYRRRQPASSRPRRPSRARPPVVSLQPCPSAAPSPPA